MHFDWLKTLHTRARSSSNFHQTTRRRKWRTVQPGGFQDLESRCLLSAVTYTPLPDHLTGLNDYDAGGNSVPALGDLDGDGDLDMISGNSDGTFTYYLNTGTAFNPIYALQTGASNPLDGLDVGTDSAPALGDLDGDGDLDLLVGSQEGNFRYFDNTGTPSAPVFTEIIGIQNPLSDFGLAATAALADLDNDSDLDVIVGNSDGTYYYIEHAGTVLNPVYIQKLGIDNPFDGLDAGSRSKPTLGDLDGDGDLDVISGNTDGTFRYFVNVGNAASPNFSPQPMVTNPLATQDVGGNSTPVFGDLDNDGDLDVISGAGRGTFEFYRNIGSPANPIYERQEGFDNPLSGQGQVFHTDPTLGDLDGDGDRDMIFGAADGKLFYYENTGTPQDPFYTRRTGAANPLNGVDVGSKSSPTLADVNADGLLDLMVGKDDGTFNYYKNTGTNMAPVFTLQAGAANPLQGLDVGANATPSLGDVDRDGDLDFVAGNSTGTFYYLENTGSVTAPEFTLRLGPDSPFNLLDVGDDSTPALGDLDGDGDVDLISGNLAGTLSFFMNNGPPLAPVFVQQNGANNPFNIFNTDPNSYFGFGGNSTPAWGDLDGDTDPDVIVGSFDGTFVILINDNEAPTDLAISPNNVPENSPVGTTVGTFVTTDSNVGDTFTYMLVTGTGDDDNASFTIVGGELRTAASYNFESKSSYTVRVRTTDMCGLWFEKALTITVSNVNENPTDIALSNNTVPENSAIGTTVGNFSSTDPDSANTFTYTLVAGTGSTENASFTIVGNTLQTAASFNFEAKSSYSIRVRTADQGGLTFEKIFTINVTDVNEAPTNIALSNNSIAENSPAGTAVGNFSSTDPDAANTFTYTLVAGTGSTDNASFTILGNTLQTAASFNFEAKSSYSIRLRSTDQGGLTFEKVFTINVTDVNEAPTDINLSNSSVPENSPSGTTVGNISTVDPDAGNTFTYTLVAGTGSTDNASFSIVGNSLRTAASFNFEVKPSYSIRIRTTDQGGLTFEKIFTINVTDVNEAPTDINLSNSSVPENSPSGTTVGNFSSIDPDAGNTFTYILAPGSGSTDNASFTIVGNSLRTAASFNFEAKSTYNIRVRTTDQGGLSFDKQFTINVTNVNETPTNISLSSTSIPENSPISTTVGTFSTTDPDSGNTFGYSLVSGSGSTDNVSFSIVGDTLRTAAGFNFEAKTSYSIRVRSTDQGGLSVEKIFTISIVNVNDAPNNILLTNNLVPEQSPVGTPVGMLSATDEDVSDTFFTFTLASGAGSSDNAAFSIAGNTLQTSSVFDMENKSSYSIRIRATDLGGLWFEKIFTINVTNVNDAPVLDNLGSPVLASIPEDIPPAANIGTLVSDIIASMSPDGSITDQDAGALQGIAIIGANQNNGTWQYSVNGGGVWNDFWNTNSAAARLLASNSNTRIRFLPEPNFHGTVGFSFVAWDQTDGVNGEPGNAATLRGGNTPFSVANESAFITVTPVNDAPVLVPSGSSFLNSIRNNVSPANNLGTLVTDLINRMAPDGGISDVDVGAIRGIAINGLNNTSNGTWEFTINGGSSWAAIGTTGNTDARLLAADALSRVRFVPNPGFVGQTTLWFTAWDRTAGTNGGIANVTTRGGSTPYSLAYDTATLTVQSDLLPNAIGVFRSGRFYLDSNDNHAWNNTSGGDQLINFGSVNDTPIVGDWNGDGKTDLGVWRAGTFHLGATQVIFGATTDIPVVGDWNGDGITDIGTFAAGKFYLDSNGNHQWDGSAGGDQMINFGTAGDLPIIGDWNGDGTSDLGVYRTNTFFIDANGNRAWNNTTGGDAKFYFGTAGDLPVAGDWNHDGKSDVGIFRTGVFYLDSNGNRSWNTPAGGDARFGFGSVNDLPVVGRWTLPAPAEVPQSSTLSTMVASNLAAEESFPVMNTATVSPLASLVATPSRQPSSGLNSSGVASPTPMPISASSTTTSESTSATDVQLLDEVFTNVLSLN